MPRLKTLLHLVRLHRDKDPVIRPGAQSHKTRRPSQAPLRGAVLVRKGRGGNLQEKASRGLSRNRQANTPKGKNGFRMLRVRVVRGASPEIPPKVQTPKAQEAIQDLPPDAGQDLRVRVEGPQGRANPDISHGQQVSRPKPLSNHHPPRYRYCRLRSAPRPGGGTGD